jgi:hypothetical protein
MDITVAVKGMSVSTIKRNIPEQERNDVFDYNIFVDHN